MTYMTSPEHDEPSGSLKDKITGLGQKIIGEIEEIGGALTGDPTTIAEGELNVEVGEMREDLEEAGAEEEG
jgi:uncharacterized protein YjbJ (UPF0337 family)